VAAGLTHVFLQVRGRFDAFYASGLEPWARGLAGTLGEDPGWDPLEHAVKAAHARGLQLHAWINVYALWQGAKAPHSVGVPHPLEQHPDWRIEDRAGNTIGPRHSYQFASPGNPEVRAHLVAVVDDLDERFDLDGIHLDYLRYPGRDWGYDAASLAAARVDGELPEDFDEWRRQQIRETVGAMDAVVDVPLTGAVWGIHTDRWGWGASGGNDTYFQDSHGMLQAGTLAAAAPMIYWPVAAEPGTRLDFATLAADHVAHSGRGRVWPGIDASKLEWAQVVACIEAARESGAHGVVLFEYLALRDNGWLDDLAELW
jgi:uncharacterized lipoprotein YddW (UPF0748 family)